jgi:hypothetical protein
MKVEGQDKSETADPALCTDITLCSAIGVSASFFSVILFK